MRKHRLSRCSQRKREASRKTNTALHAPL
jgi:hypothetical protein